MQCLRRLARRLRARSARSVGEIGRRGSRVGLSCKPQAARHTAGAKLGSVNEPVVLPFWLAFVVVALAAWLVVEKLLLPALRRFGRGRINRVLEEASSRLRISVRPFQRTRRQVLIHRLLGDPKVMAAAESHAAETEAPPARRAGASRGLCPRDRAGVQRLHRISASATGSRARSRAASTGCASASSTPRRWRAVPENATVVFVMNHRSQHGLHPGRATSRPSRRRCRTRSASGRASGRCRR